MVGPNVDLQDDLPQGKIVFVDKNSYVTKENKIAVSSESKKQLMKKLKKPER
jgi:hypothetical protein